MALPDAITARRAASLAEAAEYAAAGAAHLTVYVVGTEVSVPGAPSMPSTHSR